MLFESITKESKDVVFIYTTCPNKEEARSLGIAAINAKLAISIDYWFVDSIYPWRGVLQEVEQYMVMFSTKKSLAYKLMKFIDDEHSYITPMIVKLDVDGANPAYMSWVDITLNKKEEYKLWSEEQREKADEEGETGYHYGKLK